MSPSNSWPMIAGADAGAAAAAAVGQMIIASVSLGQQDGSQNKTNDDIARLCDQLRRMEKQLADHGFTGSDVPEAQVKKAREYISEKVRTLEDFKRIERELEAKVHEITRQKGWFESAMEARGRKMLLR